MAKKKKNLPWWKGAWQHALEHPISVIAALVAAYTSYQGCRANKTLDQRNSLIREFQIDTSIAVASRVKAIEPELAFMLTSYKERHPDIWDNFHKDSITFKH